jgi:hypothetical protein
MKRQVIITICMSVLVLLVLGPAAQAAPGSMIQAAPIQQDTPVQQVGDAAVG